MRHAKQVTSISALFLAVTLPTALARMGGPPEGGFDLSWHTMDGGGGTSVGGGFELSGTIAQHDAGGPMTGGAFSIEGGFWPGADSIDSPLCPADLSGDGEVDGADLGMLLLAWDTADEAADLSGDGNVDGADLGALLLAWGPCL